MNVGDLEDAVWTIDGIRLVVRAPMNQEVGDFDWQNAISENTSLTSYFRIRISPRLQQVEFSVIDGRGMEPNGNTRIKNIRHSYRH